MITLEQVELLRSKADVTYEEARKALEATGGDLLDAIVLLESQGKVKAPAAPKPAKNPTVESTEDPYGEPQADGAPQEPVAQKQSKKEKHRKSAESTFGADVGSMFRKMGESIGKLFQAGNRNTFQVSRGDKIILTVPITVLVIFMIVFFWAVLALVLIGMFTGFRFNFIGPDIKGDTANSVMNSAADAAETIKRDVGAAVNNHPKNDSGKTE